jgi:riboflavin synthase
MFTGIVTEMGEVRAVEAGPPLRVTIGAGAAAQGLALGGSIACAGVCLTAVAVGPGWFAVEVSRETLARSTLGGWGVGTPVNLERPLRLGDELGGHLVLGHVDGTALVRRAQEADGSLELECDVAPELAPFVAAKGSITLDGVSLTVNRVAGNGFAVNLIPHTRAVTTLGAVRAGDGLNLEIDVLARHMARWVEARGGIG